MEAHLLIARMFIMKRNVILFLFFGFAFLPLRAQESAVSGLAMTRWQEQMIAIKLTPEMQQRVDRASLNHNISIGNKKFDALASSINTKSIVSFTDPNSGTGSEEQWLILYFESELDAGDIVEDFKQLPVVEQAQIVGVQTLAFEEVKFFPFCLT